MTELTTNPENIVVLLLHASVLRAVQDSVVSPGESAASTCTMKGCIRGRRAGGILDTTEL